MKILLTGKNGQIGWELQRTLAPLGDLVAVGRSEMDLSSPESVREVIRRVRPNLIVNAAAYTSVDKAESEPDLAMQVNGIAPSIMAEEAKRLSAAMVHYSTDYVFDGTKTSPYTEEDKPKPVNVYGKTKWAGDCGVQGASIPHLILRTSWVYGTRGRNFLLTMLRLAKEQREIRVVDDQVGAPTWSREVARVTARLIGKRILRPPCHSREETPFPPWLTIDATGQHSVYNVSAAGYTSWYRFAAAIFEPQNCLLAGITPALHGIKTTDYSSPARRPANSVLDGARLARTTGETRSHWKELLAAVLREWQRNL